jgi:phage tail-like protein
MSTARPSLTPTYLLDSVIGWRQSNMSEFVLQDPVSNILRLGKAGDFAISPMEPSGSFGGQTLPTGVAIAQSGFMLVADAVFNRILYYDSLTAQKVVASNEDVDVFYELAAPANTGTGAISQAYVFNASIYVSGNVQITFATPSTYDVVDTFTSTNNIIGAIFTSNSNIDVGGVRFSITGAPAAGDVFTVSPVNPPPLPFVELWQPHTVNEIDDEHLQDAVFAHQTSAGPYQLNHPTDVAISPMGEVVVADSGNQRVMIYSWPELRLRKQHNFPNGIPRAVAYDSNKRLYVADTQNGQIYRYNSLWERDISYKGGADILQSPIAIAVVSSTDSEADKQDYVFALDAALQQAILLDEQGELIETDALGTQVFNHAFLQSPLMLEDGLLCYPQIAKPYCEKWWLTDVQVESLGNLPATNTTLLARPRVTRLPRSGVFISEQLDGEIAASQWHRITLEASIPSAGRILIQTFTSDRAISETELADVTWSAPALFTKADSERFFEVLIQSHKGRYLRIRMEFFGDGYTTPTIESVQVYGQRASSLKYLPPPYKQDPESEYFLDRWLSYFDTVFDETRFLMADFTRYLDPAGVPAGDYLDWLGSWFDWTFLAQWPSHLRREMIARSMEYFKLRGTLSGLQLMLQWHTGLSGNQPSIIEHYRVRHYGAKQVIPMMDDNTTQPLFIGEKPFNPPSNELSHWFTVVLPTSAVPDQAAHDTITAIIEAQKPAHTGFRLCLFAPGLRIGKQSSIGVDTWLGHYPTAPIGGFTLGQAAQLSSLSSPGVKIGQSVFK